MTEAALIDLRSDGLTRPSAEMRAVMAAAPVGADQFGEDPLVNRLQEEVAALLGKEAALWLPSGTMANQIALRLFTRPGDDVIVSRESHALWHESGGSAANAGVQLTEVGADGVFTLNDFLKTIKPRGHFIYPPTTLVEIENTHNRAGGTIFPQDEAEQICAAAKEHGVATFLDGARLWNAAVATGKSLAELAAPFDLVAVSLSKGLGAPGGSLLAGPQGLVAQALRYRRMFGGTMWQPGLFAAAGLYALEHNMARLAEDHANARRMAERLMQSHRVLLGPHAAETNILVFGLSEEAPDAPTVVARAREQGILVFAIEPRKIRAVTHLDVSREQCEQAADVFLELVSR